MILETLNASRVRAQTEEKIAYYKTLQKIMDATRDVLVTFNGKMINKRVLTAMQAKMPGVIIHLGDSSARALYFWEGWTKIKYDSRFQIMVGYVGTNDPNNVDLTMPFDFAKWEARHYFSHQKTIDESEAALVNLETKIANYNAAIENARAAATHLVGMQVDK
jgi:hypothetical protein